MAQKKVEFEIEIDQTGEVKVHIKGVKGKGCLQYAELFKNIVGEIKQQSLTSEYYEPPDAQVGISIQTEIDDTPNQ
jgi:invasion protein IalB